MLRSPELDSGGRLTRAEQSRAEQRGRIPFLDHLWVPRCEMLRRALFRPAMGSYGRGMLLFLWHPTAAVGNGQPHARKAITAACKKTSSLPHHRQQSIQPGTKPSLKMPTRTKAASLRREHSSRPRRLRLSGGSTLSNNPAPGSLPAPGSPVAHIAET